MPTTATSARAGTSGTCRPEVETRREKSCKESVKRMSQQRTLRTLRDKLRQDAALLVQEATREIARDDGTVFLSRADSLIDQLQAAIARDSDTEIVKVRRSKGTLPTVMSVPAFDVMSDIDKVTRTWNKDRDVSVRISAVVAELCRSSIEAIPRMRYVSRYLDSWVRLIRELFEPPKRMHLVGACPECDETAVRQYSPDDGEYVIAPALQIIRSGDTHTCECQNCGAVWLEGQFLLLAKVLGCESPC